MRETGFEPSHYIGKFPNIATRSLPNGEISKSYRTLYSRRRGKNVGTGVTLGEPTTPDNASTVEVVRMAV